MKKNWFIVFLALNLLGLWSCNDKLNIAAPYKNITLVYGLLNRGDTAHYIRIQKAFMDQNQSAIDMAKEADSSFYKNLNVVIKEISTAGLVLNTFTLNRVDLLSEGYSKDTGVFFNTPNYAYKLKHLLDTNNTYRIVISNSASGEVDSAESPVLTNVGPNYTNYGVIEWTRTSVNFAKLTNDKGLDEESSFTIIVPPHTGAFELAMRFHWTDSNASTGLVQRFSADYSDFAEKISTFTPSTTTARRFDVYTTNKGIYQFLYAKMQPASSSQQYRVLDSVDMFLYTVGIEFQRYKDLNANKGGVTANEIRPYYTNLKGQNVMGLFSTKASVQRLNLAIGAATQDSLKHNSITRSLNIVF